MGVFTTNNVIHTLALFMQLVTEKSGICGVLYLKSNFAIFD